MKRAWRGFPFLLVGLACAAVGYPALHEAGHTLAALLLGGRLVEVCWLPLPSVLCDMRGIGAEGYVCTGAAGLLLPVLLSLAVSFRRFWLWYANTVLKLICLWSLAVSSAAVIAYQLGMPVSGEDMTQVLMRVPLPWGYCLAGEAGAFALLCASLRRSRPIQRIQAHFSEEETEGESNIFYHVWRNGRKP